MERGILLSLTQCVPITRPGRVIRRLGLSWFGGPLAHGAVLQLIVFSICDYIAVVRVLNSGSSKSPDVIDLLRILTLKACRHNFVFLAAHTPGRDNFAAQALSRLRLKVRSSVVWPLTPTSSPVQFQNHCCRTWYRLLDQPVFWSLGSRFGFIHSSCLRWWSAGLLPFLLHFCPAVLSIIRMAANVVCDLVGPDPEF